MYFNDTQLEPSSTLLWVWDFGPPTVPSRLAVVMSYLPF
jgi:hypothetical protein